jgi:hypothetical protein
MPGTLASSAAGIECGTAPRRAELTLVSESAGRPPASLIVAKARGRVTTTMQVLEQRAPASIAHTIAADAGGSAFTSVTSRRTAKLNAAAGKPFLTGTLTFQPVKSGSASGACQETIGRLTGSLTARFDSIGTRQITTGSRATLSACRPR